MSSPQRIRRLGIVVFRGAIRSMQIQFRADQPIALIYGENGTGKSTIADAIDFVCNNELGSVRLRSGTKPAHVIAATSAASDLRVELVVEDRTWQARLQGQRAVTTPADPPRAFVLRRVDITRIMEATIASATRVCRSSSPFRRSKRVRARTHSLQNDGCRG